jgi:hypothetical protein
MNIIEALAREDQDVRVTCGNRWLVLYKNIFTVFGREYHKVGTRCYYEGTSEEEVIKELLNQ